MSEQKNIADYLPSEKGEKVDIDTLISQEIEIHKLEERMGSDKKTGEPRPYFRANLDAEGETYIFLSGVLRGEINNVPLEGFPVKATIRKVKAASGFTYRTFRPARTE